MKPLIIILLPIILFISTMIDTSNPKTGSCTINNFTISPVEDWECEGIFIERKI
jgi:hypothetical protein